MITYRVSESVGHQEVCVWLGDCDQLESTVVVTVSGKSRYCYTQLFHLKSCILLGLQSVPLSV